MNDKVKFVVNGFFNLSEDEQIIFLEEIGKLYKEKDSLTEIKKIQLNEHLKRSLGPLSQNNCTCCGK
jgi:hypothetical protein